jgi:cob(I)alamin adenosyltransferase
LRKLSITTKTGDQGTTQLPGGGRAKKSCPAIELAGAIDEAVAALNFVLVCPGSECVHSGIIKLQETIFAAACGQTQGVEAELARCEAAIEQLSIQSQPQSFSLRRETELSARLDLARTAVRRAERAAVATSADPVLLRLLNRASDYLYLLSLDVE